MTKKKFFLTEDEKNDTMKEIKLTDVESEKIKSALHNGIVKSIVEGKETLNYKVKINGKEVSFPIEIKISELMKIGKKVINDNSDIYEKFEKISTKKSKPAINLLYEQSGRAAEINKRDETLEYDPKCTIRQQFFRNNFQPDIIEAMSTILATDIEKLTSIENLKEISEITNHEEITTEFLVLSEHEIYEMEYVEAKAFYDSLNEKERYFLVNNFEHLLLTFDFINRIYNMYTKLNQVGMDIFDNTLKFFFPEALRNERFISAENDEKENNYITIKKLIKEAENINSKDLTELSIESESDIIEKKLCDCQADYKDIYLDIWVLLENETDFLADSLLLAAINDQEKKLVIDCLNQLLSIPEYRAE